MGCLRDGFVFFAAFMHNHSKCSWVRWERRVIESDLFPSFLQRVHQKSEMSHLVTVTESASVH